MQTACSGEHVRVLGHRSAVAPSGAAPYVANQVHAHHRLFGILQMLCVSNTCGLLPALGAAVGVAVCVGAGDGAATTAGGAPCKDLQGRNICGERSVQSGAGPVSGCTSGISVQGDITSLRPPV